MTGRITRRFDVAINGGGMVGMSLAIALARAGISVAVIEKSSMPLQLEPLFDGRVSAIAYGSQRILEGIDVWHHVKAEAEPILDIRVSDDKMPFFLHFDHHEAGEAPFGYIVENRHLRFALQKTARSLAALTIFDNTAMESFERDDAAVTVHLDGNRAIRSQLLVGADGRQSTVRTLAGIKAVEWGYKQSAIVCTIAHEQPHHGLAQERFLPAGPFAVLPMRGNRSSLVWVEPEDRVALYMALPEDEFIQEIQERVGSYLGTIESAGHRFRYPLGLMHAKEYAAHRVALIGDAAHTIHPIAGQGVNLGFRDVAALASLIIEHSRLGLDIGEAEVLAAYQRWRRFDNITMLAVTDGLNRLFSVNLFPIQLARDLGLWAVGKVPPIKRFFMRHAMGLIGDLPNF